MADVKVRAKRPRQKWILRTQCRGCQKTTTCIRTMCRPRGLTDKTATDQYPYANTCAECLDNVLKAPPAELNCTLDIGQHLTNLHRKKYNVW